MDPEHEGETEGFETVKERQCDQGPETGVMQPHAKDGGGHQKLGMAGDGLSPAPQGGASPSDTLV